MDLEVVSYVATVFPKDTADRKRALLFVLHGLGGSGESYLKIWKDEADRQGIMVVAPTRRPTRLTGDRYCELLYGLVEHILQNDPVIDRQRISLAGVSSGALVAEWLLFTKPEFWLTAILIGAPPVGRHKMEGDLGKFPAVLFVHGVRDDQFPYEETVRTVSGLREKGVEVKLMSYPDAGHEQRPEWTARMLDWMEKRPRRQS